MLSILRAAAPIMLSAAMIVPTIANAAETGPYYVATPSAAPAQATLITSGTLWKWRDTAFTANKGPQREAIMCEMVAQHAGKLTAFSAGGKAFDADALAKCNGHAK